MIEQRRNRGWLATVMLAALLAPQVGIAQEPEEAEKPQEPRESQEPGAKDTRPMLFGFMVDGRMVQARVVAGKVTATVGSPTVTRVRGVLPFPKERMKVSKGLVRFLDKDGNVAAELTHWNGGGNLTVAPRKVPVRLGITLEPKLLRMHGKLLAEDIRQAVPVGAVAPDGPADKAGMEAGDLIVEIDGQKPATEKLLRKVLKEKRPGDPLKLQVLRDGKELELAAKLEAAPDKLGSLALVSGTLDPITVWRRGRFVQAKKDMEKLAAQQLLLQDLLKKQAATVKEAKKKTKAVDVFRQLQSELKKSTEQADKQKKELDAKLEEMEAEEARQKAMVLWNRARLSLPNSRVLQIGKEPLEYKARARKRAEVRKKPGSEPLTTRTAPVQEVILVDPEIDPEAPKSDLGQQVRDLEKRLARMEKLLEESLSRQREADRRKAPARNLRNREDDGKELDARIRELEFGEGGKAGKARKTGKTGRTRKTGKTGKSGNTGNKEARKDPDSHPDSGLRSGPRSEPESEPRSGPGSCGNGGDRTR